MNTVILGNGIIALTIAFRLAKRASANDKITIIGKRERIGSATLAAAAMLNSFAEIEKNSLDSEIDSYRFELSRQATQMWREFEKELIEALDSYLPLNNGKPVITKAGYVETGTYVVNNTAADDLDDENYDAIVQTLEDFNEPFQHVSPRDIPNYMPEQRHRASRALYITNEGYLNPRLIMERLDVVLTSFPQVQFVDGNANKLLKSGAAIESVKLDEGQIISGDKFVLATGATVSDIIAKSDLGIEVQRVFYGVGVSVEIKSPDFPHTKCIRTPNRGLACGVYSAPYSYEQGVPNDHILIGASNFVSPTANYHGRISSIESIMRASIEQINFNFYRADLIRVNVGWRPTSQDTYPLLGKTSISNLIITSGTKRDGIHMSPLISENITAMLYDEAVDDRFAFFTPERKPIRTLSRTQAIDKAVRHQMSAAYQHGFNPSKSRMPDQIKEMYRDNLERLHDQVGAYDWGIPPEMLDMYRYGHAVV